MGLQRYIAIIGMVLYVYIVPFCRTEMFTALVDMEKVLYAESHLAADIRNYISQEEQRLEALRRVADDYEEHSAAALQNPEEYLANPLNAFLLVKRFTTDWSTVETLLRNGTTEELLQGITDRASDFPDQEDLQGAAVALLRLQDTYELPTSKLARGEIQGIKQSPELSASDCFELGRLAYNQNDHYHCILWMSEALDLVNSGRPSSVDHALLLDYLAYSTFVQGNSRRAHNLTLQWLELEPNHQRALNNKAYYEQMIAEEEESRKGDMGDQEELRNEKTPEVYNARILDDYRAGEEFQTYEALCRGEDAVPYKDAHKLTCQYVRNHPYFTLVPLKEEVMYLKPRVVIFHEILTDSEMEVIKSTAAPRLKRATVQNPQTGKLETAFYRVSKSAWLKDWEHEKIAQVSGKVQKITQLSLETAEELQVVNYGIGGHYEPHYDFARKREVESFEAWRGNRVATAIFYMSDVPAGGATVFPQIGIKLWPGKGNLAFWHNLLQNGEGDYETRHAACPVLAGSKWVANKWIHERGQEFMRPCSLDPEI